MKRYILTDTITDLQVDSFATEEEAKKAIMVWEKNDKEAGCYEPNSYKIEEIID